MIMMAQFVFLSENVNAIITVKNKRGGGGQGSKFKFEFGSTCATRCKFLGAQLKILGAHLIILGASISNNRRFR